MNIERYKRRLMELEQRTSTDAARTSSAARNEFIDTAHDNADAGAADEAASEQFSETELNDSVLSQVRDALRRIEDGTFGQCLVDGGPIEEKRLDALPWTPYCLAHAEQLEAEAPRKLPTS